MLLLKIVDDLTNLSFFSKESAKDRLEFLIQLAGQIAKKVQTSTHS